MAKSNNNKGFSLIETLLAMGIMGFIVITILSGFSQQQMLNKNSSAKNIAVSLAETKMEELLKYPSSSLTLGITTDYIIASKNSFSYHQAEQNSPGEFKRTWEINLNGDLLSIEVEVEYGNKTNNSYPFRISLSCQRGG